MDFSNPPSLHCCEILDLLPLILNISANATTLEIAPSSFNAEMKLSTEERLQKLKELTRKPKLQKKKPGNTFDVVPSAVIFQNFKPGVSCVVPISLRNTQSTLKPLRAVFKPSPHFTVSYTSENYCLNIAPGMAVHMSVQFCAEEAKDYKYQITFMTEEETFILPVIAIGPRPILDLPDHIDIPNVAVKLESKFVTLVRNVGQVPATFTMTTSPPFFVNTSKGILLPNQDMQLVIYFKPMSVGKAEGNLIVAYESGEKLFIKIKSYAEMLNIFLEKGSLKFTKTFMGLTTQRTILLTNNSQHIIKFKWKLYQSLDLDQEQAEVLKMSLNYMKANETIKSNKLEHCHIIDGEAHERVYNRVYEDEIKEFDAEDQFMYFNHNFQIIPMKGEMWPNTTLAITSIFSPAAVIAYDSRAYLEVSGRPERLKLVLCGEGIGPEIVLSLEYLNVNKLYMCAVHQYEIIAINKGDIPGEIAFTPIQPDFGSIITCNPESITLKPTECGTFIIDFCGQNNGKFYEEVRFEIKTSSETLSVYLEGEVICPLLRVENRDIDLGVIPIGYPRVEVLTLQNPAMVPIEFAFIVLNDGYDPSLTCQEYAALPISDKGYFVEHPKEVELNPFVGIVEANSSFCVNFTVTPNIIREHTTFLCLKMWNSYEHAFPIQIRFDADVPEITCIPNHISIKFCFVRYPYKRLVIMKNNTNLPGYFRLIPDAKSKEGGITYDIHRWEDFVEPFEEVEIDVTITTTVLGEDYVDLYIQFFGADPILLCPILCKGQGPVVTIDPDIMDFGKVKLLQKVTGFLTVTNESPIAALVSAHSGAKSKFCIEPMEFVIQPEDCEIVNISLCLYNPTVVKEKLKIRVQEGADVVCPLRAKGYGTSIFCEPELDPVLDLGTILTYRTFIRHINLTNMGSRGHKMLWSHNGELKSLKESPENELPSIFKIHPKEIELSSKENIQAYVEGFGRTVGCVEEDFYCYAMIENQKELQTIINCKLLAKFVDPVVLLSKIGMSFRKDIAPDYVYEFLKDELTITNHTSLPIEIDVSLKSPFYIVNYYDSSRMNLLRLELDDNESRTLTIGFELFASEKRCLSVESFLILNYVDHPKIDRLPLYGEVNYPTVEIISTNIDFHCVPPSANNCKNFIIKNISPLKVNYAFEWQEDSFYLESVYNPRIAISALSFDSRFSRKSSDSGVHLRELELERIRLEAERVQFEQEQAQLELQRQIQENKANPKAKVETVKDNKKAIKAKKEEIIQVISLDSGVDAEGEEYMAIEKEYYYERTCVEKQLSFYYTQIRDVIKPSILMNDALIFSGKNQDDMNEISIMMNNFTFDKENRNEIVVYNILDKESESINIINRIFNVAPVEAILKPYECQYVSIVFYPIPNINVNAELACHILGGATEFVSITGTSSEISFSIDNAVLDFGRQVFCMPAIKFLTLTNTGFVEFAYVTTVKALLEEMTSELFLEAGSLIIFPKEGSLLPGESVQIQIKYFPGIAGEFNETFTIEVEYLSPVTITAHGYGVFPQVYLYLPRPSLQMLSQTLSYLAVASLTPDYLRSLKDVKNILHYNDPDIYDDDIPVSVRQKLRLAGWKIISYNDLYPSIMDVDLAIERLLLYQHIFEHPSVFVEHTKVHKGMVIPNFVTPPYLMDFGHVVLNTDAYYTILIFNYGPINAEIKLTPVTGKKCSFGSAGLELKFSRCVIPVANTKELSVLFHPKLETYPDCNAEVLQNFYLQVAHGPTITVTIKAIVTVPIIKVEPEILDFYDVRCGDCKKRSLLLHNTGHITSVYTLGVQRPEKKKASDYKRQNLFFIKQVCGVLKPNSSCLIDVFFEPQYDGLVEWSINIVIEQNPNQVIVDLRGRGMKPTLKIKETFLEFEPVLPYVHKCEQVFTIENTSEFPVEIFFSDFDTEADEEEKVTTLITQFYNLRDLYVPPRTADDKLPLQFYNFYTNYYEQLRNKLIRIEEEKLEEPKKTVETDTDGLSERRKSSKRRSSSIRQKNKSASSASKLRLQREKMEIPDPFVSKTIEEIEKFSENFIKEFAAQANLHNSAISFEHKDPIGAAIAEYKGAPPAEDPTDLRDGVFIIFHGGPGTNVLQSAKRASKETGLQHYSIDKLILECLVTGESDAITKLNGIIDAKFTEVASEIDLTNPEDSDEYDELKKKVDLLLSGKEKKKKEKPGAAPSSVKSDKPAPKKKDPVTFMNIPEGLFFEILLQKIATFKTGIVIESLNSEFLRRPLMAFNNLLNAIGNVRYIHFIILSYTMENNTINEIHLKEIEEKLKVEQREALLENLLEMDEEEFSKISPEEFNVFKEHVIESRKLNSLAKLQALQQRLLEKKGESIISGAKGDKMAKPSEIASKGAKSVKEEKPKLSPEEIEKKLQFTNFENDTRNMLHTLEYWDRKACILLKPYQPNKGGSKAQKSPKPTKESTKNASSHISTERPPTPEEIPLSPEEELQIMQTGIPCWTILNAHKGKPIEELVAYYLTNTPDLKKARVFLENTLREKLEEEIELFSVIRKPHLPRSKNVSDIFILKDAPLPIIPHSNSLEVIHDNSVILSSNGDVPSQRSSESKKSKSSKRKSSTLSHLSEEKRKSTSSGRSRKKSSLLTEKSLDQSSILEEVEETFTQRVVLNPGDVVAYKVIFKPEACNVYNHTFSIEIHNWIDKYRVGCIGACDVPKIDMNPEIIFKRLVSGRFKKHRNANNLFIKDLNAFHFGPILINGIEDPAALAIKTEFNFSNKSLLPCETSFYFYVNDGCYECNPHVLDILQDSSKILEMYALPVLVENTSDCLLLSVKNNPKIEVISLLSQPCTFEFNVTPKELNFEHVPISQKVVKFLLLENTSHVPVNWEFLECEDVYEYFNVWPLEGIIQPESAQEITVEFHSNEMINVPKQNLKIFVFYGVYKRGPALYTEEIGLVAEAMEVKVECSKEIVFGEMKGKFEYVQAYSMLNKGKYNVQFSFTEVLPHQDLDFDKNACLRNYFKMVPIIGVLLPGKILSTKLVFYGRKALKFDKVPILDCTFIDVATNEVIDNFPLLVSGAVFFSSYEFCPTDRLNFGYQMTASEATQEIVLKNTGKFEFTYTALSLAKILEIQKKKEKEAENVSKKDKKKTESSKASSKTQQEKKSGKKEVPKNAPAVRQKMKPTTLTIGIFSLTSAAGIIYPNETEIIKVASRPKQIGNFVEKVVFFMSECRPRHKDGIGIDLTVTALMPKINLTNMDIIFREQYVVDTLSNFKHPSETGAHAIFIKEEERLHFSHVMINTESIARICLKNESSISGVIAVKVVSETPNVFVANPNIVIIENYSTNYSMISFIPPSIGTFYGVLELSYESSGEGRFEVELTGDGIVPEVVLQEPKFNLEESCYTIKFNPIPLGEEIYENISFKNVGTIPCQVIVEICEGSSEYFTLIPCERTKPLLRVVEEVIDTTAHTNIVNLTLDQSAKFELKYKSSRGGEFTCMVKLHTINNPYETIMIFVAAEAFENDIIFHGLPTYSVPTNDSVSELQYSNPGYELDFGHVCVNLIKKKSFKITNLSSQDTYKFEFGLSEKILFIPSKGHLKPKATKDVIVTVFSKDPFQILKELMECFVTKIQYINPELELLSWDERQNVVIWEPISNLMVNSPTQSFVANSSYTPIESVSQGQIPGEKTTLDSLMHTEASVKTIKEKTEPEIEVIPESSTNFQLCLSVLCNYSSYECSETKINIRDTLLFEKHSQSFFITNTSNVCLNIRWIMYANGTVSDKLDSTTCVNDVSVGQQNYVLPHRPTRSKSEISIKTSRTPRVDTSMRPCRLTGSEHFFDIPPVSTSKSSLFSSEANLCKFFNVEDSLPFTIVPESVSIAPNETTKFEVVFAPVEVCTYFVCFQSHIANLHPALQQIKIEVKAKSLLPIVHFDLKKCDYLDKRITRFCDDIADSNTLVVKFEAVGVGLTYARTFNIVNPSSESFHYEWFPYEKYGQSISLFHCHKPEGFIEKHKMTETAFSFLPQNTGLFEAFYMFKIAKYNFVKTFLLVGMVREPVVYFSTSHVHVKPTVLGIDVVEYVTLKNTENFDMDFSFKKDSLYSEGRLQSLIVAPLKGYLRPQKEQNITITFHPINNGEVCFKLKCSITKMKKPLSLPVTAYCHDVQSIVTYETDDGRKISLDAENPNILEFKYMIPHVKQKVNFNIANIGVVGFYYSWSVKEDCVSENLKINFTDKKGFTKSNAEVTSLLTVIPVTKIIIKKLVLKLEIRYGPTYVIHLKGQASQPPFTFSDNHYNFGACLVQNQPSSYYTKIVEFKNNDELAMTLECTAPDQDFLSIDFRSKIIPPKKSEPLLFLFHPFETKRYHTEVKFYINSKLHILQFSGEGVLPIIKLSDPNDKFIDLGSVPIGGQTTKSIKVTNNSVTPIDIIFNLYDRLPYFARPKKILKSEFEVEERAILSKKVESEKGKDTTKIVANTKSDKKEERKEVDKKLKTLLISEEIQVESKENKQRRLIREFVSFTPKDFTRVLPKKSIECTITYAPTELMDLIQEKVYFQIQDFIYTLGSFKARSLGSEFSLDKNLIPFGTVIFGYQSIKKAVIYNLGQIGGSFKWTFDALQSSFTISPVTGYIAPGTSVTFSIAFKPMYIANLFQNKLQCTINCFEPTLELIVSGACFDVPVPNETLKFLCNVRETDSKNITVKNPTIEFWTLTPTVNGQYFNAPPIMTIEPNSTADCEITFKPLTMSNQKPHEAIIYINFPEGPGLGYKLEGTTKPPNPIDTITREICAKVYHVETLNISNWLKVSQIFKVVTEPLLPQTGVNKTLYKFTGNSYIEVLPQSERDYLWKIYVLNEGTLKFNVKFLNESTNEYAFYEVALIVTKSPFLEEIKLTTCIRNPITHIIKLQNPIKTLVTYTISSTSPELIFDSNFTILPLSEYSLEVTYDPVTFGEQECQLNVNTIELGSYTYNFILTANSPTPESAIIFSGALGQTVTKKVYLENIKNVKVDFTAKFEHEGVFHLEKAVSMNPLEKIDFGVTFEPNCMETIRSSLILDSPITGMYTFPLTAICKLPTPQGPYFIQPGGTIIVSFKNPFKTSQTFNYTIEPAIFSLKIASEEIAAKQETKIIVSLVPLDNLKILISQKYPITGKLVIQPTDDYLYYIKWVYYLQGDLLK